jgi:tetratricopeptide (TPR) repeat protein
MDNLERLDQYLDRALPEDERYQLELELRQNAALRAELEALQLARQAVVSHGLRARVRRLHPDLMSELAPATPPDARVVALPRFRPNPWLRRVAASVLLLLVGLGGYWWTRADADRIYDATFTPYHLPVARGQASALSPIDSLYQAGRYGAVADRYRAATRPTPRDRFLAGVAYLQLGRATEAVAAFEALRAVADPLRFKEETDFYLALAYLRADRPDAALALFEHIRQQPTHTYYGAVSRGDIFATRVLLLRR